MFAGKGVRLGAAVLALTIALSPPVWSAQTALLDGYTQAIAEGAAEDRALAEFYAARNYAPIWTTGADAVRRAALLGALENAAAHGLPAARYDAEGLRAAFEGLRSERERGLLEARMSRVFLTYAHDISNGILEPAKVDPGIVREIPRADGRGLLEGFVASGEGAVIISMGSRPARRNMRS